MTHDIPNTIRKTTREFIADADIPEIKSARDINDGWCRYFAKTVYCVLGFPDDVRVVEHVGRGCAHIWIEHDGKAYDSEAPDGVDHWTDLPFNCRRPSMRDGEPIEMVC